MFQTNIQSQVYTVEDIFNTDGNNVVTPSFISVAIATGECTNPWHITNDVRQWMFARIKSISTCSHSYYRVKRRKIADKAQET